MILMKTNFKHGWNKFSRGINFNHWTIRKGVSGLCKVLRGLNIRKELGNLIILKKLNNSRQSMRKLERSVKVEWRLVRYLDLNLNINRENKWVREIWKRKEKSASSRFFMVAHSPSGILREQKKFNRRLMIAFATHLVRIVIAQVLLQNKLLR